MREIKFRIIVDVEPDVARDDPARFGKSIETVYFILDDDFLESPFKLSDWAEEQGYRIIRIISKDQYTNLKDKNNKEIYEGDIVQYNYPEGPYELVKFGKYKVDLDAYAEYSEGPDRYDTHIGWYVTNFTVLVSNILKNEEIRNPKKKLDFSDNCALVVERIRNSKIIGNIYENPELIK